MFRKIADAVDVQVLPGEVPRGGRRGDGERAVHRGDGRLRPSAGVQQH